MYYFQIILSVVLLLSSVQITEARWKLVDRSKNSSDNLTLEYDPTSVHMTSSTTKQLIFRAIRTNPNAPINKNIIPSTSEATIFHAKLNCTELTIHLYANQEQLWNGQITVLEQKLRSHPIDIPSGSMFDPLAKEVCTGWYPVAR